MSEVIQNKESFIEKLKKLVKREAKSGISKEKHIEQEVNKMLEERRKLSPIIDPEEEKRFMAEARKSLSKAYNEKEAEKPEADELTKKQQEAKQIKGDKLRDIESKDIGYLDRLELLHQMKMRMLREQKDRGDYVPSTKEAYKMYLLQASVEKDRELYVKDLDANEMASVIKLEEKYKNQELDINREQNKQYREQLTQLASLNKKLKDINDWFEETQEEMRLGKIDPDEYKKAVEEKQVELEDTLNEVTLLNPQKLQEVADEKDKQARLERNIMGRKYSERIYLRSTDQMKERLDYAYEKGKIQAATVISENRYLQRQGLERTVDNLEYHKKELEKKLDKLEKTPENIEKRAEIIKELRIVDTKIDSYERTKENIDQAMDKDISAEVKIEDESKKIQEDVKQIEQDFEPIDEVVEKSKKDDFDLGKTESEQEAESKIRGEALKTGVKAAVVTDVLNGRGGKVEAAAVGVVAGKIKENSLRNEWENAVSKEYNEADVEKKIARDRALQEELDEQEKTYELERTRRD